MPKNFEPRKMMELAIEVMKKSIQEPRNDGKSSPNVGALLIFPDSRIETAFRGELRHGDHAEFTLLERKNRANNIDGGILFATLEPCAPGARKHPKLGCAERIVNARIKEVYVGIEDPDPTVDRKGIKYLQDNGIIVHMFDADLQEVIRKENEQFIIEAEERAKQFKEEEKEILLSKIESTETTTDLSDLSVQAVNDFLSEAGMNIEFGSDEFNKVFLQLGMLSLDKDKLKPTGIGLLLFGKNPQIIHHNAIIKASLQLNGRGEEIIDISGPLTEQPKLIQDFYRRHIGHQIDRTDAKRDTIYDYPLVAFREAIINAIVHRDYDIGGAPIYFTITEDSVTIKSPGAPVSPITLEQISNFTAPSLSRNPKIVYVFNQMRMAEQRGLGFKTIRNEILSNQLPAPIITYDAPYLTIVFPRSLNAARKIAKDSNIITLTSKERSDFERIRPEGSITTSRFAELFSYHPKNAQRILKKYKELGLVLQEGKGPSTIYKILP